MLRTRSRLRGGGGVASTPFDPSTITDMYWFDSSTGVTSSLGLVSAWTDRNRGEIAAQGVGVRQPSTGTQTINGINAIEFCRGAAITGLEMPANILAVPALTNFEIYGLASFNNTSTETILLQGTGSRFFITGRLNLTPKRFVSGCNSSYTESTLTITANTNPHVFGQIRNGSLQNVEYDSVSGTNAAAANPTASIIVMGCSVDYSSFHKSAIRHLMILPRASTPAEKAGIISYLRASGGI